MTATDVPATRTAPPVASPPIQPPTEPLRHLLSIEDLDPATITTILDTAERFREVAERPIAKVPTLRGRVVCNLFLEDSTRTRLSFEVAAKRLSADVINFTAKGSSVSKGESFKDTALTLRAMGVDTVVVRSHAAGAPVQLRRHIDASIVNAGDGWHQHPTQGLLDLLTIRRALGRLDGLRVTVCGDVLHSRVARSLVQGLTTMGAVVTLVSPPTLLPPRIDALLPARAPRRESSASRLLPEEPATTAAGDDAGSVTVARHLDDVLPDSDVVYLLRVQRERMHKAFFPSVREYHREWGMDARRLQLLQDHTIVMHPGPMNRGVEISAEVADSPRARITDQVTNGIAVRMAVLYLLSGAAPTSAAPASTEGAS